MCPTVADNRTSNRLILRAPVVDLPSVTAEVAGSGPVVPATLCHTFSVNSGYIRLAHQPSLSTLPD